MWRNDYDFQRYMSEGMREAEAALRRKYEERLSPPEPVYQAPQQPKTTYVSTNQNNALRVDITDFKELSKYPRHPDGDSIIFINEAEGKIYIRQINLLSGNWELLSGTLTGNVNGDTEEPKEKEETIVDSRLDLILEKLTKLEEANNDGHVKGNSKPSSKSKGSVGDDKPADSA